MRLNGNGENDKQEQTDHLMVRGCIVREEAKNGHR